MNCGSCSQISSSCNCPIINTTTGKFRTGIKEHAKLEYCGARGRYTHFAGSHIGGIHILTSDISLRSKRFRLVSEQEIPRNGILGFGRARNETRATLGSRWRWRFLKHCEEIPWLCLTLISYSHLRWSGAILVMSKNPFNFFFRLVQHLFTLL